MEDPVPFDAESSPGEAIARFASSAYTARFPASARHVLKLSLLDWCAVAMAGVDQPVSRIARTLVAQDGGAADSRVFGLDAMLPARAAALANGAISHALDYDDTHFDYIGHPSVAIFPAALALAEKHDRCGRDFLDAALIGVESACRIGAWLGGAHYRAGFHQTATSGAFGATAAASRLLKLDRERTRHALGVASTRASGLKSQFGTMGKPFNAGIAACNGVEAAQLAALGFVSRPDGLECEQGFAATHAGARSEGVFAGLGEVFRFETVQHKFHACCHGLHAGLEALIALRDAHAIEAGDVSRVTISVNPTWLNVCDIFEPKTGLEAKFSYRLTAAMALQRRDTSALATFSDAACREPKLVALRDLVHAEGDASLNETSARVRIERASGSALEAAHDLDAPLPIAMREAKVRAKAAALLGAERAHALWRAVNALDDGATRAFVQDLRS